MPARPYKNHGRIYRPKCRRRLNVLLGHCTRCKGTRRFDEYNMVRRCLACGGKTYRALKGPRQARIHFDDGVGLTLCGCVTSNVAVAAKKSLVTCLRCLRSVDDNLFFRK